jgi:hypothetical protein
MFLSFLKSMQTKSQGAQNPGLWVNGMRMPVQEGTFNMLPSITSIGRGAGIIGNALAHPLDTAIKSANSISDALGNAMVDTSNIQKQTQDEEASRRAATAKANPDLADKIRQNELDRKRNMRIYRNDGTKRQESDPGSR